MDKYYFNNFSNKLIDGTVNIINYEEMQAPPRDLNFLLENLTIYKNPTKEKLQSLLLSDENNSIKAAISKNHVWCCKGSGFLHCEINKYLLESYNSYETEPLLTYLSINGKNKRCEFRCSFCNAIIDNNNQEVYKLDNIESMNVYYSELIPQDIWECMKQNKNLLYIINGYKNICNTLGKKHD